MVYFGTLYALRNSARTIPNEIAGGVELLNDTQSAGWRIPVKKFNRSHRVTFMVGLLILAVALTTALVVASERNLANQQGTEDESGKPAAAMLTETGRLG